MIVEMPKKVTHVLKAVQSAHERRDYPVLSGLLVTHELYVRQNGDDKSIASINDFKMAEERGAAIEAINGRLSELNPEHPKNQRWLRLGMFGDHAVPAAL